MVAKVATILTLPVRELRKLKQKARTGWTYCPTNTTYGLNRYVCVYSRYRDAPVFLGSLARFAEDALFRPWWWMRSTNGL